MFLMMFVFLFLSTTLHGMNPYDLCKVKQFCNDYDTHRQGDIRSVFYPQDTTISGSSDEHDFPTSFMIKQFLNGVKNGVYFATRVPIVPLSLNATMFGTILLHSIASAPSAALLLFQERDRSNIDVVDDEEEARTYCYRTVGEALHLGLSAVLGKIAYGDPTSCLHQVPRRIIGFTLEKSGSYALKRWTTDDYEDCRTNYLWHGRAAEGLGIGVGGLVGYLLSKVMGQLTGLFVKYASQCAAQMVTQ